MVRCFFIFLLFIISPKLFAINGIVTVLEAPLFLKPDINSKIIQHVRKGHHLFIHDAEANLDPFRSTTFKVSPNNFKPINKDLYLTDQEIYIPQTTSKFYKTLTRTGQDAFILKEHIFLEYKDRRELSQKIIKHDNTDYRLEEPLDKDYPFFPRKQQYRGITTFSLGQPNFSAYPHDASVIDGSNELTKEINFIYSRLANYPDNKLYFGIMSGLHFSGKNFVYEDRIIEQDNLKFYLGPYLSYDIFEAKDYYLTLSTSFLLILYDEMEIKTTVTDVSSEELSFLSSLSIEPNFGSRINFRKAVHNFDLSTGFNIRSMLPKTYKNKIQDKQYEQSFRTELSYFIGLQSAY